MGVKKPEPNSVIENVTNNSAAVLNSLITEIDASSRAVIATSETKELHNLRVTLRKLRAWLSLGKKELISERSTEIKGYVRWLSGITGPARDADVHLAAHAEAVGKLPKSALERLEQQRREAYSKISTDLQSTQFTNFKNLLLDIANDTNLTDFMTPELIEERVIQLAKKTIKQGDELGEDTINEEFHKVRKLLKKFRYTLGFLIKNSPDKKFRKTEKSLKQMQEYLGNFQDQTVLAAELVQRANELMTEDHKDRHELFELGVSVGQVSSKIQYLKSGFGKVYEKFSKSITKHLLTE